MTATTATIRNITATATFGPWVSDDTGTTIEDTLVITFSDDTPAVVITGGIPTPTYPTTGMLIEAAWELGRKLEHGRMVDEGTEYTAALAGIQALRALAS